MKKIFILLLIGVLASCGDKKPEVASQEMSNTMEPINESVRLKSSARVPSLNFDELNTFLTKENDSTYIINFWATWCKPCIKELPAFEEVAAKYSEAKVKVILVSLDFPDKLESQVIPFIDKNEIKSQVILLDDADANRWIPKVSKEWSGAIPATIIYNGNTRKFYERSFTYEELEKELELIL
ncbi:TlpA disulfide reductase family protein [Ulvibacter antarcticus]|uniref:Thiol-disulfide isomerase/thioredoxin n=1 Tax=Ulvibacter antarcticus TaxID=442714 RepID=A0A3L9Y7U8_9FLAO|nr:TlpA disulfide reductase family protein [Ulvibacter antarcticus]RMA56791.1 thiol-disulfide isomerase/thioredoxin [Ulvibacter antarcticus]